MCLILDANLFGLAFSDPPDPDHVPLLRWLTGEDGLVALGGSKYAREIKKSRAALRFFTERSRAGQAHRCDDTAVDDETQSLQSGHVCKSDDEHIIALARVSGARVVCTADADLMHDVGNAALLSRPRGRVYQRSEHAHLLRHDPGCEGHRRARQPKKRTKRG